MNILKGKVEMKKSFPFIFGLIAIDQIIKLIIASKFFDADLVLLPGILFFRPVQNRNLSWIASLLDLKAPVLLMIAAQLFALIIIYLSYRYFSYLWIEGKKFLNGMLIFIISGIICSFIDVVFWGGSLDFIRLFNWFTFDLKDIFLNMGVAFLLLFITNYYIKAYHKMDRKERRQTDIWIWIKKGMPNR